jgi:hypothetical protein
MRRIVLFPDTNIFLQCKALAELPWRDTLDFDEVCLVAAAPVQDEIDQLKYDGNRRRSRRARAVNSLFTRLLEGASEELVLREHSPRVLLTFAPSLPAQRETPQTLDPRRPDDRLIEEVLLYRRHHDPSAVILTGDTGLRLRARRHEVPTVAITEAWLLPEEGDERDKEIARLTAELAEYQQTEPELKVVIKDADGQVQGKIAASLQLYAKLTADEIVPLMEGIRQRYPKAKDFGMEPPRAGQNTLATEIWNSLHSWHPPKAAEIDAYEKAYAEWLDQVRSRFEHIHSVLNVRARILALEIELSISGVRPADEVLFELVAHDGVKFYVSSDGSTPKFLKQLKRLKPELALDAPPVAPKGKYVADTLSRVFGPRAFDLGLTTPAALGALIPHNLAPAHRDRHIFYRDDGETDPSARCSFSRAEFRHSADTQLFRVWLVLPLDEQLVRSHVRCRVSARNLTKPVDIRLPIELTYDVRSSLEIAQVWKVRRKSD